VVEVTRYIKKRKEHTIQILIELKVEKTIKKASTTAERRTKTQGSYRISSFVYPSTRSIEEYT